MNSSNISLLFPSNLIYSEVQLVFKQKIITNC